MSKMKDFFVSSAKELKVTQNMAICAMMAALSIVLSYTTSIAITPEIRIGFSGIPNRIVDFLFGPITGAIFGGMMDILKFLIKQFLQAGLIFLHPFQGCQYLTRPILTLFVNIFSPF